MEAFCTCRHGSCAYACANPTFNFLPAAGLPATAGAAWSFFSCRQPASATVSTARIPSLFLIGTSPWFRWRTADYEYEYDYEYDLSCVAAIGLEQNGEEDDGAFQSQADVVVHSIELKHVAEDSDEERAD